VGIKGDCGRDDNRPMTRQRRSVAIVRRLMRLSTRRRSDAVLLACAFAGAAVSACGARTQASTAPSAAQVLRTALNDANKSGPVHEEESVQLPSVTVTFSDDVAAPGGRQEITKSTGERAHVLIVGARAYYSGNQAALVRYFGLPPTVARAVGTRWVAIPSSSSDYSTVANDATLSTALGALALTGHLTETGPITVNGQSTIGIHSNVSASGTALGSISATVYVSRARTPLPVGATYTYSRGGSASIRLSNWGEPLALHAPTHVVRQSALGLPQSPQT